MDLVKGAVSMAKDGLSSEESTRCTFANEPQALDFCRTIQQAESIRNGICKGCPHPLRNRNDTRSLPSTSLPGLISPEDHLLLFCWREGN